MQKRLEQRMSFQHSFQSISCLKLMISCFADVQRGRGLEAGVCSNFNFTLVDSKVGDFTMKTMLLLDTFSLNI